MAHVTCLAAARHKLFADRGWDVEQRGLAGAPALRILTSTKVHHTVHRAVRLLGLGTESICTLRANSDSQLDEGALSAALEAEPDRPTVVLLQAGDLNVGAFDSYLRLIPLAQRHHAWVHIDGAFGLWLQASPRLRHLTAGVEQADSWATDGHKWLNVPYDCGYAFVRRPDAHRAAFALSASYVDALNEARDAIHWTPEWSRRARGFATYAAIRELGEAVIAAMIERCCSHAHRLVTGMGSLPGAEVLAEPQINQGLVRFLHPAADATGADHDRFTDLITRKILTTGEALFSNTTWRGKRAMRVSVCNWQTSAEDVRRVVEP
jgi:glutamate/tyrosine decarboxylase-like PLP-dependent enzyme